MIRNRVVFYSDDIKIFNVINGFEDALSLQADGDATYEWCTENDFVVNMKKGAVLAFRRTTSTTV